MDFLELEAFVTLAQCLSFREAASRLFITQPALSHRIRDLEDNCGLLLFERNSHSVKLTKAGETLLPRAKSILAGVAEFHSLSDSLKQGNLGVVSIGFLGNTQAWTAKLLSKLRQEGLALDIKLSKGLFKDMIQMTNNMEVDAAIVFDTDFQRFLGKNNQLEKTTMGTLSLQLVTSLEDFPEKENLSSIAFEAVQGRKMVFLDHLQAPLIQDIVHLLSAKYGVTVDKHLEVATVEELYTYVESGYGITISPENQNIALNPQLKKLYLDIGEDAFMDVSLIWNKTNNNPALKRLVEFVRNSASLNPFSR